MIRFFPARGRRGRRQPRVACLCLVVSLSAGALQASAHGPPESQPAAVAPTVLGAHSLHRSSGAGSEAPSPRTPAHHAAAAPVSPARTLPVTTCSDDGGSGTLRTILGSAASGDTIDLRQLACSTIVLQGGEIETAVDDLVIAGPGRDTLVIDAADASRIFLHTGNGTLALHAVTLTRGRVIDGNGGCVSSSHGSIALVDATVAGCTAHDASGQSDYAGGGGLFAAGDITLLHSTVRDNTASADAARVVGGGGLLTRLNQEGVAGNVEIARSVVSGNRVLSTHTGSDVEVYGGGIDSRGTVRILHSVVSGNAVSSASSDDEEESITEGGGVNTVGLYALGSSFNDNRVENSGGAMDVAGGAIAARGTAVISGSTIEHNHAGMLAGGIVQLGGVPDVSRLEIVNSTVSHNTAGFYGAGIAIMDEMVMMNSTVAFNAVDEASPFGIGGILIGSNDTINAYRIYSSIISNNQAGSEVMFGTDLAAFIPDLITIAGSSNLVGEASGLNLPGDTLGGDPLLLPLADYGGPTRTHALAEGSPAIDAGSNAAGLAVDQRGGYHVRAFGAGVDIGAFETQPTPDGLFRSGFESAE